ncbi:MAG: GC-type dockerin domain-anchored protein [Phycisphaerales bacterium]
MAILKLGVAVVACTTAMIASVSSAQVVFVDAAAASGGDGASWGSAFNSLQAGLAAARSSLAVREVRVAQGVYRPGVPGDGREATFRLVAGVSLRGGYAGVASSDPDARDLRATPTVLSGDLAGNDTSGGGAGDRGENAYHVVSASGLAYPTVIDGFHITGGRADGAGSQSEGGGLRALQCGANLTVSRCIIRDNDATLAGGVMIRESQGLVTGCVVAGNRAVSKPGMVCDGMATGVTPRIDHCTFAYNASPTSATSEGFEGRAMVDWQGVPTVVTCCISFGNGPAGGLLPGPQYGGLLEISHSLYTNGSGTLTGTGNIGADPMFADPAGADGVIGTVDDDWRLRAGSPAVDVGDTPASDAADTDGNGNTAEPTPLDADGLPRVFDFPGALGSGSDIGAFEGPALAPACVSAISVSEGSQAALAVTLSRPPAKVVTVLVVAGAGASVSPTSLQFSPQNWSAPQTVTVSALADTDFALNTATLILSGAGLSPTKVAVSMPDTDVPPGVVYVNPQATGAVDGLSWATAFRTLQAALAAAAGSPQIREVWIKEGVYAPTPASGSYPENGRFSVRSGVKLVGGFAGTETAASQRDIAAHPTVLSGDMQGDDAPTGTGLPGYWNNALVVVEFADSDSATGLDGLVISGARQRAVVSGQSPGRPASSLGLVDCRFTRNWSTLFWSGDGSLSLTRCVMEDNNGNAGQPSDPLVSISPFSLLVPDVALRDCRFSRNYGAGIVRIGQCALQMTGCVLEQNAPWGDTLQVRLAEGPGIQVGSVDIADCSFIGNSGGTALSVACTGNSGGVATRELGSISRCVFRNNQGNYQAATSVAPDNYGRSLPISSCLFEGNVSQYRGAALGVSFTSCIFRDNSGAEGAAAVAETLTDCLMERNTASVRGGATTTIGRFTSMAINCTFRGNSAPEGGAVTADLNGAPQARGCVFEGNSATSESGQGGGAIRGYITAVDCLFIGNTSASVGGAGRSIGALSCRFAANHAAGNGGAVAFGQQITSCLFTGNSSGASGGAIYSPQRLSGCTVYGNTADGAIGGVALVKNLNNCIVWANRGSSGTVLAQQASYQTSNDDSLQRISGLGRSAGQRDSYMRMLTGPVTGFDAPLSATLLDSYPTTTEAPYAFVETSPPGVLSTLPADSRARWIGAASTTAGPWPASLLLLVRTSPNDVAAKATLRVRFAADDGLGDALNAGVFYGSTPLPGSTGGSATAQTDWLFDVSDLAVPFADKSIWLHLGNHAGFGGTMFVADLTFMHPNAACCLIEGFGAQDVNGNSGADPMLASIAGLDGVVGTADDDATPAPGSPAIDSGNARLIPLDFTDIDRNGDLHERVLKDLTGGDRIVDVPQVADTSVGLAGPVDRGAVEALPPQTLLAPPCYADVGSAGGVPGSDGVLDNNDFIAFINAFFARSPIADIGSTGGVSGPDGSFDNNDFIAFISRFFAGC